MALLETLIRGTIPGLTAGVRTALPYLTSLSLQGTPLHGPTIRALAGGAVPPELPVLSANEIIRRVRSSGFTVNRQLALKVIKALKQQVAAHAYITNLANGIRPLRARVPLAGSRQRFPYHARVAVNGRDPFTGEIHTQFVTITDTRLFSKATAKAQAALAVLGNESYQMTDITGLEVVTYTQQNPALNQ